MSVLRMAQTIWFGRVKAVGMFEHKPDARCECAEPFQQLNHGFDWNARAFDLVCCCRVSNLPRGAKQCPAGKQLRARCEWTDSEVGQFPRWSLREEPEMRAIMSRNDLKDLARFGKQSTIARAQSVIEINEHAVGPLRRFDCAQRRIDSRADECVECDALQRNRINTRFRIHLHKHLTI